MLQPLQSSRSRIKRRVDKIVNTPVPVMGWVSESGDSIASGPGNALILDNLIPTRNSLRSRGGSKNVSNLPAGCQTLMNFSNGAVDELIGATATDLYRIPKTYDPVLSPVAPVSLISGLSGGQWQSVSFANAADVTALLMVNGVSAGIRRYDGAAVTLVTPTTSGSGIYSNISSYKGRVWCLEVGTSVAYYGDPLSNSPASMTAFPVGPFLTKGGDLIAVGSWSRDGGSGPDDLLVFISTKGEIVIYTGSDPGSDFNLVGVFVAPEPMSRRCLKKAATDLMYYSTYGPMKLSEVLPAFTGQTLDVPIRQNFSDAVTLSGASWGWEFVTHSRQSWILYNVPIAAPNTMHQYVVNMDNGSWFRITGWNAQCWAEVGRNIYFADPEGKIFIADYDLDDNGLPIHCDWMPNWYNFGVDDNKKFNIMQLTTKSDARPAVQIDMMLDYDIRTPESSPGFAEEPLASLWNVSPWDTSPWSGSAKRYVTNFGIGGIGGVAAARSRFDLLGSSQEIFGYRIGFEVGDFL